MNLDTHPVDALAAIRSKIKLLEQREAEIRDALLAAGADLNGEGYRARITIKSHARVSAALLAAHYGAQAVDQCSRPVSVTTISLRPRRKRKSDKRQRHPSAAAATHQHQSISNSTGGV